jgi:hypothetical protein
MHFRHRYSDSIAHYRHKRNLLSDIWTDTRVLIRANINGDSALQGQEIIEWE